VGRESPSKREKPKATKNAQKRAAYPPIHCIIPVLFRDALLGGLFVWNPGPIATLTRVTLMGS